MANTYTRSPPLQLLLVSPASEIPSWATPFTKIKEIQMLSSDTVKPPTATALERQHVPARPWNELQNIVGGNRVGMMEWTSSPRNWGGQQEPLP